MASCRLPSMQAEQKPKDLDCLTLVCAERSPTWQMAAQADSHAAESPAQVPCCIKPAASAAAAASSLSAAGGQSVRLIRCLSCARANGTPPFCFASSCEHGKGALSWVGDCLHETRMCSSEDTSFLPH